MVAWLIGSLLSFLIFIWLHEGQRPPAGTCCNYSSTTTYVDITMSRTSLLFRYVLEVDLLIIKSSQICHLLWKDFFTIYVNLVTERDHQIHKTFAVDSTSKQRIFFSLRINYEMQDLNLEPLPEQHLFRDDFALSTELFLAFLFVNKN